MLIQKISIAILTAMSLDDALDCITALRVERMLEITVFIDIYLYFIHQT